MVEGSPYSSANEEIPNRKRRCCTFTKKCAGILCIAIGLVLITIGLLVGLYLPSAITSKIAEEATVCSASEVKENFINPFGNCENCVPVYFTYHPFTILNAEQVLKDPENTRFHVRQLLPVVYRKYEYKVNIQFDKTSVSYQTYTRWELSNNESKSLESQVVTRFDPLYLGIMTRAGGEKALVAKILSKLNARADFAVSVLGGDSIRKTILQALNGINSLDPEAMEWGLSVFNSLKEAEKSNRFFSPFKAGVALYNLGGLKPPPTVSAVALSGVFTTRTVRELAYGTPSFWLGLALKGATKEAKERLYKFFKTKDLQVVQNGCASCNIMSLDLSFQCRKILSDCQTIKNSVTDSNTRLCPMLKQMLDRKNARISSYLVSETCGACNEFPEEALFCLAQMPGDMEKSGYDYNVEEVGTPQQPLKLRVQSTGCNGDIKTIANFSVYDDTVQNPVWPSSFTSFYENPLAKNMSDYAEQPYCVDGCLGVSGGDGGSFTPGAVSLSGLPTSTTFDRVQIYVDQFKQSAEMTFTGERHSVHGVSLVRFARPPVTERASNVGEDRPTKGIFSLAFNAGVLAYVSLPFFMDADPLLLRRIQLEFVNGEEATLEAVQTTHRESLETYLDIEPTVGKTFNTRKRLMASFAVTSLDANREIPVTDLLNPKLPTEVIVPALWVEEKVTITPELAKKFKNATFLTKLLLPTFIAGLVLGVVFLMYGTYLVVCYYKDQDSLKEPTL